MTTTIHVPSDLLKRVDRRAGALGISRNRYILRALERAVEGETTWSREFLHALEEAAADTASHEDVKEMMRAIRSGRSRKKAPRL